MTEVAPDATCAARVRLVCKSVANDPRALPPDGLAITPLVPFSFVAGSIEAAGMVKAAMIAADRLAYVIFLSTFEAALSMIASSSALTGVVLAVTPWMTVA